MARTPLMAGNWKMNLDYLEGIHLVQQLDLDLRDHNFDWSSADVVVIPPFTSIRSVQTVVEGDEMKIAYGAQDVSVHDNGAYTGEVSAPMLKKLGCSYIVVGHSERREYHNESDELVGKKAQVALAAGMTPIICCGEGLDVRKAGEHVAHVVAQIKGAFAGISAEDAVKTVVAYEPIWAIGTGEVATPEDAQEVCEAIRATLAELYSAEAADQIRVLYGGSVKSSNVADIMAKPDVDGALVGGASLKAEEFSKIARFAQA
ncbi:triose-phosphate isomerase [Nanchangia anserum]|uniref:Triosephosphate isomerase n=1 Tax=Nanchangia anserum TaxID=2692125 RepID=A0A8I0GB15_9ACTO|nr:triose-phosphate isomerase [Nanchangia anserum]MBD3688721.1 triose-phosphate isomerase [Nanchangia anserum]QOX82468.1 triose-phosphate isomerase [Nanchangia anserum]